MTHEEREALRGLCEDAWFIYVNGKTLDSIRLVALLDALDEAERQIGIAKKECPNGGNDGYITPRPCQCEMESLAADRDQYKARAEAAEARAEALERAIKSPSVNEFNAPRCPACTTCTGFEHERNCGRECGAGRKGWQFDQPRFTKGGAE